MADFKLNSANHSPSVNSPPFFASGTVSDGGTATITFDNVTQQVNVICTSGTGGVLKWGVPRTGVAGTASNALAPTNSTGVLDMRVKQIVLAASGADMGYQLVVVLDRTASADYPDITTGNGFSGV